MEIIPQMAMSNFAFIPSKSEPVRASLRAEMGWAGWGNHRKKIIIKTSTATLYSIQHHLRYNNWAKFMLHRCSVTDSSDWCDDYVRWSVYNKCQFSQICQLSFADILFQHEKVDFYAKTFSIVLWRSTEHYFVSKQCVAGLLEPRAFESSRTGHRKSRLSSLRGVLCAAILQPLPIKPPHSLTPDWIPAELHAAIPDSRIILMLFPSFSPIKSGTTEGGQEMGGGLEPCHIQNRYLKNWTQRWDPSWAHDVLSCCGRGSQSAKQALWEFQSRSAPVPQLLWIEIIFAKKPGKISGYPSHLTSQSNLMQNPRKLQEITFWCRNYFFDKSDRSRIALTRVK